jgi:sterol desaturase/sphingolipid hydroxylase (fatty acid hydroxylase superfamily)
MAIVIFIVTVAGLLMLSFERTAPGRRWLKVQGWLPRALAFNAAQACVILLSGYTWNHWLQSVSLLHVGGHGLLLDAAIGYFTITFVFYWWHRWRHEVPQLWLWLHQIHHSPKRLELLTTFYKHPLEIVLDSMLSSLVTYAVLGLSPAAATLAFVMTGLAEMFYHWNISTPRWIGYFIQRPESHCVHHQRGVHRYNYSDLPIWDMLFGTFKNPAAFTRECGFDADREERVTDMLRGRNVLRSDAHAAAPRWMRRLCPAARTLA